MSEAQVVFSIARHAAWAPGLTTPGQWAEWARAPWPISLSEEPKVTAMPAMLRRRAGFLGRMALEVAFDCLGERRDVPTVFCSRHGEVARAVELLGTLAQGEPLSPTAFGLAVHNATAGLFSIARSDRANHVALAGGAATIENAVIEACGLLADGAPQVLLVACDTALPDPLRAFEDCDEQPWAFAWLMSRAEPDGGPGTGAIRLSWRAGEMGPPPGMPGGLALLRFQYGAADVLEREAGGKRWTWSRHAA